MNWIGLAGRVSLGAMLAATACWPQAPGAFSPSGYRQGRYGYKVAAVQSDGSLMPPLWELDNYYGGPDWTPKDTPEYRTEWKFDVDGDGEPDVSEDAFTYDLRWVNVRNKSVIWLRSIPVDAKFRDVDLAVLVDDLVDEISGGGYEL